MLRTRSSASARSATRALRFASKEDMWSQHFYFVIHALVGSEQLKTVTGVERYEGFARYGLFGKWLYVQPEV